MEPIVVAAIGAVGGLASGLVVALAKPLGEDWQERRRERRKRRLEDLDRLADAVRRQGIDGHFLRIAAASTADSQLVAHVGRLIVAATPEQAEDARGDASHRIGQLRSEL